MNRDLASVGRSPWVVLFLALGLCLFGMGCDEDDVVFIRIEMNDDLSGTLTTCGVRIPDGSTDFGGGVGGVKWETRARLECATGSFSRLEDLRIGDLTFSGGVLDDGFSYMKATLPRGSSASWPRELLPETIAERRAALLALDPKGRAGRIGTSIKLEILLPGTMVSQGVQPVLPGVEVEKEKNKSIVVFPLKRVTEEGDPVVCHLTWQSEK